MGDIILLPQIPTSSFLIARYSILTLFVETVWPILTVDPAKWQQHLCATFKTTYNKIFQVSRKFCSGALGRTPSHQYYHFGLYIYIYIYIYIYNCKITWATNLLICCNFFLVWRYCNPCSSFWFNKWWRYFWYPSKWYIYFWHHSKWRRN